MRLRTPIEIGLAIRERRRALGLDQKALADRIGVSRQWVIEMERGKRRAELWLVLRALDALDIVLTTDGPTREASAGITPGSAATVDGVIEAHRRRRGTKG